MIWIVGPVFKDYTAYLADHQIEYGVFTDRGRSSTIPTGIPTIPLDFSSPEALITSYEAAKPDQVSGLLVAGYENYVLPAAILADHLGLPGPQIDAARAATNKYDMRQRFQAYDPTITPQFTEVETWEEAEAFATRYGYPVMLKPTNLMKSLLITKNTTAGELRRNFEQTQHLLPDLYRKYNIHETPRIIIEEFMQGSMHTVAGFVDAQGMAFLVEHIADCTTAQERGVNDSYLYSRQLPTKLSVEQQKAVLQVAAKGVAALNLTSSALHIEIMYTTTGPKIIEIGARIGGYRPRMYAASYGLDLLAQQLAIATAQTPRLDGPFKGYCAVFELFADRSGTFAAITTKDQKTTELSVFSYASIKVKPGDKTGPARDGYKAAAVIIVASPDEPTFRHQCSVVDNLVIQLAN